MHSVNVQKLERYLSSLECPVCHRRTEFTIVPLPGMGYRLVARPSCCCEYWRERVSAIFRIESTRAENCELTGTTYQAPA